MGIQNWADREFRQRADEYYAHYLAKRNFNFKAESGPEKDSKDLSPEGKAHKHLKEMLPYLEKQYLKGEVTDTLYRELRRADLEKFKQAAQKHFEGDGGAHLREVYGSGEEGFKEYLKAHKKGNHAR